jgi:hypothetical protein
VAIRPDALMIPSDRKVGGRTVERVRSITDIAEPLLGTDYTNGERAWIRTIGDWLFVTTHLNDTLFFDKTHDREGQSRYAWVTQPDGMKFGFYVDGAND